MLEVLQKVADLIKLLEEKNASTDTLNKQLSNQKLALADVERRQMATDRQLSARERLVSKSEETEKSKQDMKDAVARALSDKIKNNEKAAELAKEAEKLAKDRTEVEGMRRLFTRKNENMDNLKVQLEKEKKLMREKILEELKGKLSV